MKAQSNEDQLEALARSVLTLADPPPQAVVDVAKLCYEFRGMSVLNPIVESELAGARSTSLDALQAEVSGRTIRWAPSTGGIEGLVAGSLEGVSLALQTTEATTPIELDDFGSFFIDQTPSGPFRLVVRDGDGEHATPWES